MGIGISSFTEIVGAGPSKHFDILGHQDVRLAARSASIPPARPSPASAPSRRARATRRPTPRSSPRSWASRPSDIEVEEGDTDTAPYGLGTYASRSHADGGRGGGDGRAQDPRQGDARSPRTCSRSPRTTWSGSRASSRSRARPSKSKTIQEIAFAAYTNHPQGMEAGLEAVSYYDPPNLTFPFGSYICVVDIDRGTGEVKVRRFVAIDDCGNIINPMIVEGQIHGGLTMGLAPALFEEICYDENGNIQGGSFMDYLVPTAVETPNWETGQDRHAVARITRSAPRASASRPPSARPPAIVNAVVDALCAPRRAAHRHPDHAREGVDAS